MTLDEARQAIGRKVVYWPPGPARPYVAAEEGVITSVNDSYVFVRYGSQAGSAATNAENLEFIS